MLFFFSWKTWLKWKVGEHLPIKKQSLLVSKDSFQWHTGVKSDAASKHPTSKKVLYMLHKIMPMLWDTLKLPSETWHCPGRSLRSLDHGNIRSFFLLGLHIRHALDAALKWRLRGWKCIHFANSLMIVHAHRVGIFACHLWECYDSYAIYPTSIFLSSFLHRFPHPWYHILK